MAVSDRGLNQDEMKVGAVDERDPSYRNAGYLGTDESDEEEVQDLGFIVDNHDDRRGTLTENWQRLDDLDTDEPLETNRSGAIPNTPGLIENANPPELFATDFNHTHRQAEEQLEDFVATSMLDEDPDMNDGSGDFTSDSLQQSDGIGSTDILGNVAGMADGLGSSLGQDLGSGGFHIEDNPVAEESPDLAIAREKGEELDDYDDDKQEDPTEPWEPGIVR